MKSTKLQNLCIVLFAILVMVVYYAIMKRGSDYAAHHPEKLDHRAINK